jgi:hypothetical protein
MSLRDKENGCYLPRQVWWVENVHIALVQFGTPGDIYEQMRVIDIFIQLSKGTTV